MNTPAVCIEPYLFFNGRCDEALAFYQQALGAEVDFLIRFKDSPEPCTEGQLPPDFGDKVMHATFRIGGNTLMASDGDCAGDASFSGFALSYNAPDEAQADQVFQALADGGKVIMPLGKTFWSPRFGMLTDRFGIQWMVGVLQAECAQPE